jgi:hypothetical protein
MKVEEIQIDVQQNSENAGEGILELKRKLIKLSQQIEAKQEEVIEK